VPTKLKIKAKKPTPIRFATADFAHPDERRAKLTGIGVGVGAFLVILGVAALTPLRLQLVIAWTAWTVLALLYFVAGASGSELRRLAGGAENVPRPALDALTDTVAKQARAVGIPAAAVVAAGASEMMTVRGLVLVPPVVLQRLSAAEIWALTAREIGLIKAGDVGLLSLCRRVGANASTPMRILALPLQPLARALANWQWYAALTADHMGMVLTRDRRVVAAALLKQATAGIQDISAAEIDEYLKRHGSITAQTAEVMTHFKLGEVLRSRSGLTERLRAIGMYAESDDYKRACDRLDAAYAKAQKDDAGVPQPPRQAPRPEPGQSG
jgi:hypothetical protein